MRESTALTPTPTALLATSRYALLRTFRSDGSPVDTPIWFHLEDGVLTFRSKRGPKIRRLSDRPEVELWPCDYRGRPEPSAAVVTGRAALLVGDDAEAANRALHRRYGWQWNVVPMIKVPGVPNVHRSLPWREKLRRMRTTTVWRDSVIVRVELIPGHTEDVEPR